MRFSEAKGQKVVSTSEAVTVAKVDGFVVVPGPGRVLALKLKKTPAEGELLRWSSLTAFGRDAVTVPSGSVIEVGDPELTALADKHRDVIGRRVLDDTGTDQGKVVDVDFDLQTGDITTVITDRTEIPGSTVIGLGSYALVVRAG